ncbi:MAG: pilus assembly protein PilP [Betaproteobacteria bacterium]
MKGMRRNILQKSCGALLCVGLILLAAGCGRDPNQELRQWMDEQAKNMKGKVDPLPVVKPYVPFAYNAFDLPDPFKPRKIEPARGSSKLAPDLNRRKEPLESYPIESLRMVGTLQQNKTMYALVRTSDKNVFQVRAGNYMGQNFGIITGVGEGEIKLRELVQDSSGDWAERQSRLLLDDQEQKK